MQQSKDHGLFDSRLEKLENQIAFQELTIEQLNQSLIDLQREISLYREQLRQWVDKISTIPTLVAPLSEEAPPPHY